MTDVEKWLREWSTSEQDDGPLTCSLTALTREQVIELLTEIERLRGEVSGYREHISQWADVKMYDRNLIKALTDDNGRLRTAHDDYVVLANANVCELNREIERLRDRLARIKNFCRRPTMSVMECAEIRSLCSDE